MPTNFNDIVVAIVIYKKRKYNDTNGAAAENDIWCPRALQVVIQDGTGEGAQRDQLID
jgi:hypothetical protein